MPLAALCLALLAPPDSTPMRLAHKFTANEKLAYAFNGHLTIEFRQTGLQTWIPSDQDIAYGYTLQVQALKNDGFAVVRFLEPSVTETAGETYNSAPKAKVWKVGWDYLFTLSPVNEVTEMIDRTPKKKKGAAGAASMAMMPAAQGGVGGIFGSFVDEVHRLATFVGTLDIAPRFPLEPVKIGDTWQRTIGYQPQKLKGKEGKSAVQRLDYTYTYLGPGKSEAGKPVLKVQAKLKLDTDLGDFIRSLFAESSDAGDTRIKEALAKFKIPLNLNATSDFDLDPKTHTTLYAFATSDGGFTYNTKGGNNDADYEERFKGRTTLDLVGRKIAIPAAAAKKGKP